MSKKDETKDENMTSEKVVKEDIMAKENVIYLGPDIPGVVSGSTVFKDGILPETVNEKIKAVPMLANLFVPISEMVEAVKEVDKTDSPLRIIYEKVKTETLNKEG